METLIQWDQALLIKINSLGNNFWDPFMLFLSHKFVWIPLYIFLLILLIRQEKKNAYIAAGIIFLLVLSVDQGSVHFFKNVFERLRPCHEASVAPFLRLPGGCGGLYGFISSHAANTFALAFFLTHILKKNHPWIRFGTLFLWAAGISYSRMYLGVHYPGDILGGFLYGILLGYLYALLYELLVKKKLI